MNLLFRVKVSQKNKSFWGRDRGRKTQRRWEQEHNPKVKRLDSPQSQMKFLFTSGGIKGCQLWSPYSIPELFQLNPNCMQMLGNSRPGSSFWVLQAHVGDLYSVFYWCFWPGPGLATVGIWGANWKMGTPFVSLSVPFLHLSLKFKNLWK